MNTYCHLGLLYCSACFLMSLQVGQKHGGFTGMIQKACSLAQRHIWFERKVTEDRKMVANRFVIAVHMYMLANGSTDVSSTSLWAYITLHAHSDIELVVSLYIVETTVYNARINNQRFSLFKAKRVLKCYFSNLLFIFRLKEHISDPSNNPILIFPEGNQWWQCTSHRWIQSINNMLESFYTSPQKILMA